MKRTAKLPALLVAVIPYFIGAGIFTQSGIILPAAARDFHATITDTSILFSYLNAGNVGGVFISIISSRLLSTRQAMNAYYGVFLAGVVIVIAAPTLQIAFVGMALAGLGTGGGVCAGAIIIAETTRHQLRAVGFLATDLAFTGGGFIFPALSAGAVAANVSWRAGYAVVAAVTLALMIALAGVRLPALPEDALRDNIVLRRPESRATLAVALFSSALALVTYVIGQDTFTIWAPTYLQNILHVPALQAGTIVSDFYGPAILGLLLAAGMISRISPNIVLGLGVFLSAALALALAATTDVRLFFGITFAFGFSSACIFKLLISIGSDQEANIQPQIVTLLLFAGAIGGAVCPVLSATLVRMVGSQISIRLTFISYGLTAVLLAAAYASRVRRGSDPTLADS